MCSAGGGMRHRQHARDETSGAEMRGQCVRYAIVHIITPWTVYSWARPRPAQSALHITSTCNSLFELLSSSHSDVCMYVCMYVLQAAYTH